MMEPIFLTNRRRERRAGFTLIEMAIAMAILALIAAIAVPRVFPGNGATAMRSKAYQLASILRADRNAAIEGRRTVNTVIDVRTRHVHSGAHGGTFTFAGDYKIVVRSPNPGVLSFTGDGRSSGGLVVLEKGTTKYTIDVNPLTAAVSIMSGSPL